MKLSKITLLDPLQVPSLLLLKIIIPEPIIVSSNFFMQIIKTNISTDSQTYNLFIERYKE